MEIWFSLWGMLVISLSYFVSFGDACTLQIAEKQVNCKMVSKIEWRKVWKLKTGIYLQNLQIF